MAAGQHEGYEKEGLTTAQTQRAMRLVQERYDKLSTVVDSLSEKTQGLLMRERQEFLAAYRAHTYKIQLELKELRRRVAEENSSNKREDKMKRLVTDHDWFRDEALRREDQATKLSEDISKVKQQLERAEEDRAWLVSQLSDTKKKIEGLKTSMSNIGSNLPHEAQDAPRSSPHSKKKEDQTDDAFEAEGFFLRRQLEEQRALCRTRRREIDNFRKEIDHPSTQCIQLRNTMLKVAQAITENRSKRLALHENPLYQSLEASKKTDSCLQETKFTASLQKLQLDRFTPADRLAFLHRFLQDPYTQAILSDSGRRAALVSAAKSAISPTADRLLSPKNLKSKENTNRRLFPLSA